VEDHEALETRAVIGELADAVENQVNNLFANRVVATSIVIGSVFLARNQLLGMVELAVGASTNFIAYTGLKIDENSTRDVLAGTSFREEGVKENVFRGVNVLL
jgi:hypothetical protein